MNICCFLGIFFLCVNVYLLLMKQKFILLMKQKICGYNSQI